MKIRFSNGADTLSRESWNTGTRSVRICRESLLTKVSRITLCQGKETKDPFLPPGEGKINISEVYICGGQEVHKRGGHDLHNMDPIDTK